MLHAAFLRSPYAHARILRIETSAAERAAGRGFGHDRRRVRKDLHRPWVGTLSCFPGMKSAPQYPMAVDRACWAGEPVAMVIAQYARAGGGRCRADRDRVAGAAGDRRKKPRSIAIRPCCMPSSATISPFARSSIPATWMPHLPAPTLLSREHSSSAGIPRSVWSRAHCWPTYDKQRSKLTITTSSQCPHMIQRVFAHTLGVPDHNVQVVAPDVGGSFGLKIHSYGDEVATVAAAIALGRPVKFIADRLESFVSDIHARENSVKARMAVSKFGRDLGASISTCFRVPAPIRNIHAPACSRPTRSSTSPAVPTGTNTTGRGPPWSI